MAADVAVAEDTEVVVDAAVVGGTAAVDRATGTIATAATAVDRIPHMVERRCHARRASDRTSAMTATKTSTAMAEMMVG